jgi:hypothetical protein
LLKNKLVSKKIFHKLLFITPLLGLILTYVTGINTFVTEQNKETTVVQFKRNTFKAFSFYHEIEESNDNSDFFYEESELEDDFEFDDFIFTSNSETFTSTVTENQKLYNKTSFCLIQKSTPLYDLFCNWKHHLS